MNIFKYPLKMTNERQDLTLPAGAKIIHAGFQNKVPCIWALHSSSDVGERQWGFLILPTGESNWDVHAEDHISTVQIGVFVWHFFGWIYQLQEMS